MATYSFKHSIKIAAKPLQMNMQLLLSWQPKGSHHHPIRWYHHRPSM